MIQSAGPVGAVCNRTESAQLETAPTEFLWRVDWFIVAAHGAPMDRDRRDSRQRAYYFLSLVGWVER